MTLRSRPPRSRVKLCLLAVVLAATVGGCATFSEEEEIATPLARPSLSEADIPAALEEAERAAAEERYEDAYILLGRILRADATNARANLQIAEIHLATGKLDLAAAVFEQLAGSEELGAKPLQGRGIALLLAGKLEAAREVLEKAVEEDPALWRAWNALAVYYDSQGLWNKASDCYGRALEAQPDSEVLHNNRGYSLLMQGRFSEAEQELAQALKIKPAFRLAQANLRVALAWQGEYREAALGVERKELPGVLNNVGYIAMLRGDFAEAETYLVQAMEASPSFHETASKNLKYLESLKGAQAEGAK